MAYGRLDVFWPDGTFKAYPLVENTISIGRSTGNTLAFDTNTLSRYHAHITHQGEQVFITDLESVNGTFVDSEKLDSNAPKLLMGGEEIQIGHLRMIYHRLDEMPTQPMLPMTIESTQRIELRLPSFQVDVLGFEGGITPGAYFSAEVGITNTSLHPNRYRVELLGAPDDWIRLDPPELQVEPEETGTVLVNIKPTRVPESQPGDYPLIVKVSQETPAQHLDVPLQMRVLTYSGLGAALEPTQVVSGGTLHMHLHNQGNAPLTINLSGQDRAKRLEVTFVPPRVTLAPGQRLSVAGSVRVSKPRWFGTARRSTFDVHVKSNDVAAFLIPFRATFSERPMLPTWAAGVAGLGGLALFAVVMLALLSSVITGPRPENTPLPQTSPTALVVIGVTPTPALEAGVFTAQPAQITRYVVQSLTVHWDIPGAVKTRLTGLEGFSISQMESTYGGSGTITGAVGIANEPLRLTLFVEDAAGNVEQRVLNIPVSNPQCLPTGNGLSLYAGTDTRHPVVNTVAKGQMVVVDAQDSGGTWLHVQLPSGSGWTPLSSLACQNFQVRDLYKELNIPTPPPVIVTATPMPPTATLAPPPANPTLQAGAAPMVEAQALSAAAPIATASG